MKMYNIKEVIKEHFFTKPTDKLRVREIERVLKLSLPSVIRYCKELEKEKILTLIKIGNVILYTADRNSDRYILEKKLYNLKILFESQLIEYLKIEFNNPGIILFGSFAKGEDIEKSDIDLYLETPSIKQVNLEKYEKKLDREIQIIQNKGLKEISNIHLANNIINGVILNGFIEVFK